MATTPTGTRIQEYINSEIRVRGIDASATVVEGQDNLSFGVHIRGAVSDHFVLDNGYIEGLSEETKATITEHLNRLGR